MSNIDNSNAALLEATILEHLKNKGHWSHLFINDQNPSKPYPSLFALEIEFIKEGFNLAHKINLNTEVAYNMYHEHYKKPSDKYRLGRKEKRAILEVETGKEHLVFPVGNEDAAMKYCIYLNKIQP
jgi:hypothetical protein